MERETGTQNHLQALQASEIRYRRLFEAAQDGILILNAETGEINDVNPYLIDMLHYSREEFLGMKLWDVSPFKDKAFNQVAFGQLQDNGYIQYKDLPLETKEGEPIAVEFVSNVYMVNGDKVIQCNIRNITRRKKSEEALRISQVQLSQAMDLAKVVHWELDPKSHTYLFNDPFYVLYGTTAEQEGGYRMTREEYMKRFLHPDDLPLFEQAVKENITEAQSAFLPYLEHRIIRRDGEVRHVQVRASVVKDDSGRVVKRYGANQDITDRKEMAKSLQESGEQFEKLFMESPLGMVMVGADGRFIRANTAFCRMLDYTEQELTSLHFKDITHPDHIAQDVSQANDLAGGKTALYQTDKQYIRKDKGIVWASVTVNIMRDRNDRFLHFFTTVEDITVRKHAEEALNQSLNKLRKSLLGTIQAMTSMVERRDPYTAGHEKRVSMLARAIAQELGLSTDVIDSIRMAAAIHDIGKISVPAEILSKPGRLSDTEMSLIKIHSQTGYDILKDVDLPFPIAKIVLQHHERLNGSGYPKGVKIGEILFESRIVSVADVVEAMASHRPYRPALGIDAALEEIEKNKGIFYDAVVVDACVRLFREKRFKLE
jgi:PAS domain S-box-containing protein/putative nucleotidyltransferase with HDIG domain